MVVCKSTQKKQRQYVKTPTKTPSAPCLFYSPKTKKMIAAILIITGLVLINLILLVIIRWDQDYNHKILYKHQHSMWDDITQIGRTVRAIDRKIDLNEHLKKD